MTAVVRTIEGGQTEVSSETVVDLTGRIMQVGRGMIQGVAHQIFLQFVGHVKERLAHDEAVDGASAGEGNPSPPAPAAAAPIAVIPLLLKTLWAAVLRLVNRLLGREST